MVILDPSMESAKMKHCLQTAAPHVIITKLGMAKWNAATLLYPSLAKVKSVIHLDRMEDPLTSPLKSVKTVQVAGSAELAITL
jgi:hypothetical protein